MSPPGERLPRHVTVLVGAVDGATGDEAFRAAVGLSLRGARVHVIVTELTATLGPDAQRARALLELMGHTVDQPGAPAAAIRRAHVVEVWGPAGLAPALPAPGTTAHLVRPGRRAACPTPGEPVLHLPPTLARDDADRFLDQLLAADRVVVW